MTDVDLNKNKSKANGIGIVTYQEVERVRTDPTDDSEDQDATLSAVGDVFRGIIKRRTTIAPENLQEKLSKFLESMDMALRGVPALIGAYKIDEIELTLEIGAEGELSILGTGGKLTGKSGITLTLKHVSPTSAENRNSQGTG